MDLTQLKEFLGWCLVINFSILMWWFVFFTFARLLVYRIHTRWFQLSEERFDSLHYLGMAIYEILILTFNLAPYVALCLIA
ncbi:MAG: hypothetical protein ACI97A_002911 [Planctomycetota bacterium]|jgi:hypothetical protein